MIDDTEKTKRVLQTAGYQVFIRQSEWCECLIVSDDDRWLGMGADASGALRDALSRALPSRLARQLFERYADAPNLGTRTSIAPAAAPAVEAAEAPTAAPVPAPADVTVPNAVTVAAPEAPLAPPPPEAPVAAAKPAPAPPPEAPPVEVPRLPSTREVLDELKSMRRQIETDSEELALASPRRQRLVLLGWIARARAAQMAYPDDAKIDTAVATIARVLTGYCQTWWPGSVRALKVTTRPEDVVADLTMQVDRPPTNWQEACDMAERNVRQVEEDDENRGRDGYGWSDVARLSPPPRDADGMLVDVIRDVEALSGPIGSPATLQETPEPGKFLDWARKLRWARETTNNPIQWGALMGRFRFWIRENASRFGDAARTLDPDWSPDRSWAAILGLDPETIARNREIRELFTNPPKPTEEGVDATTFNAWLAKALTYSDTHLGVIVSAMRPFKDHVLALDAGDLPGADRRMRRRFSKLQKEVALPTPSQMPPPPEPIEPEPPESPSDPSTDANAIPEALRGPIARYTKGKRALFVSNRADPNLQKRLKEIFEFEDLDWSAGETKRRQSLVGPIQSGSYNFVLGATGFLSHSIDGQISQACRKGQVPYVRVHRGRPLACLRAMARELGLEEHSGHRASLED